MTTSLRSSIAVSASLLAARGFWAAPAHPRHPKSDTLLSDASETSLPLAAALRGGSASSLASLVANGLVGWQRVFLELVRYSNLEQTGPSTIGRKPVFFSNFYSITKNIIQMRSSLR